MKIELIDRQYWLEKCEVSRQKIMRQKAEDKAEYDTKLKSYDKQNWWKRFWSFNPRYGYWPNYGRYGLGVIKDLESMLESEHTGSITLD